VPHSLIVDNLGGHLMQHGMVDLCLVGSDRTTRSGDVCNKIGTYLKALAAKDNGVPFYVCLPGSTIDWSISDGVAEVPIEQRDEQEVSHIAGRLSNGEIVHVSIVPDGTTAVNYAFDVTPARLVSGLVTERGIVEASANGLELHFPEASKTDS
jgi:methylthioribose-1-phosphate isomerase